jgi:hypothetical protein
MQENRESSTLPRSSSTRSSPFAGMMARRLEALLLNEGFSVTVSLRALMSLDAIFRSLDQAGSKPQLAVRSWRWGSAPGSSRGVRSRITRTGCVGATL